MRRGTKTSETPTSAAHSPYPAAVLSPTIENAPAPPTPVVALPPINPTPRPAFPAGGTLPTRAPGVSTGKAKKVMDWFRKKSLVQESEDEGQQHPAAPQVFVTGTTASATPAAGAPPATGSAPPSSWTAQRVATTTGVVANGAGLLHPPTGRPTRAASTSRNTADAQRAVNSTSAGAGGAGAVAPPSAQILMHQGAVDPLMVATGASADQIYAHVLESLRALGIHVQQESTYKATGVRPKQPKSSSDKASGSRQSALAAFSINGLSGSNGVRILESLRLTHDAFALALESTFAILAPALAQQVSRHVIDI